MARVKEYVGCGGALEPDDLDAYEATERFVAEEKRDGCWCLLETDEAGIVKRLSARAGLEFENSHVDGLLGFPTHLPNAKLVGELETASQSATKHFEKHGFRRFHAFDVINAMNPQAPLVYRRGVLEGMLSPANHRFRERILPVDQRRTGFRAFYDEVLASGGEGLVVKPLASPYLGEKGQSGKRRDWFKVKPLHTVDYVCIGIGETDLGNTFMELGLWANGKLKRISKVQVPTQHRGEEAVLIGKVIEIKGAEIFDSGVVRHGRFNRLRDDKEAAECTVTAALAQRAQGGDF